MTVLAQTWQGQSVVEIADRLDRIERHLASLAGNPKLAQLEPWMSKRELAVAYVTLGLPDSVVAVQLGHDGPDMVRRLYGHGNVGALERIEAAFGQSPAPVRALREAG